MSLFNTPIDCVEKEQLIINPDYKNILMDTGLDSFESVWQYNNGEIIKNIKTRSVIRIEIEHNNGKRYFYLKKHNKEYLGLGRLFNFFFHRRCLSQGQIEFENIIDFRKCNLATVVPVVAGHRFVNFFWVESFLITEDFSPFISLEYLLRDQPDFFSGSKENELKRNLLNKIAVFAKKMHSAGFNHRDFNATHILLNFKTRQDAPGIALFDLQRVSKRKFFRFRWIIKSLAELNYTLPNEIFDEKDRNLLFLSYKEKSEPGLWDRFQLFWIKKKTARIKRHTEKRNRSKQKR